jgi:hypothetical protein
MSHNEA